MTLNELIDLARKSGAKLILAEVQDKIKKENNMAEIQKTVKIKKHEVKDCEIHGYQDEAPKIEQTKQPENIDISVYKNRTDYK